MQRKLYKKEERGLKGGPNHQVSEMMGAVTTTGYWPDSPDRNNDFNIIPSNEITMQGMDIPLMGIDNLGNMQHMIPGQDYTFPGSYVTEIPMAKQDGMFLGAYMVDGGTLKPLPKAKKGKPKKDKDSNNTVTSEPLATQVYIPEANQWATIYNTGTGQQHIVGKEGEPFMQQFQFDEQGRLMSDKPIGDMAFTMPTVTIQDKAPEWAQYEKEFLQQYPTWESYGDTENPTSPTLAKFFSGLLGAGKTKINPRTGVSYAEEARKTNWELAKQNYIAKRLLEANPEKGDRQSWLQEFDPAEQDIIRGSRTYGSELDPNAWQMAAQGLYNRLPVISDKRNLFPKDLSLEESQDAGYLSALGALAIPAKGVQGWITQGNSEGWAGGSPMPYGQNRDVFVNESGVVALDPLNLVGLGIGKGAVRGLSETAELMNKAGTGLRTTSKIGAAANELDDAARVANELDDAARVNPVSEQGSQGRFDITRKSSKRKDSSLYKRTEDIPDDKFEIQKHFRGRTEDAKTIPKDIRIKGESGTWQLNRGKNNTFYFNAEMSNPVESGRAMMKMNELMPPKPTILEPKSYSLDSWYNHIKLKNRPHWSGEFENYIPLNHSAIHNKSLGKYVPKPTTETAIFKNQNEAEEALQIVNKFIDKQGISQKAKVTEFTPGRFQIEIPNFKLTRDYQIGGPLPKAQLAGELKKQALQRFMNKQQAETWDLWVAVPAVGVGAAALQQEKKGGIFLGAYKQVGGQLVPHDISVPDLRRQDGGEMPFGLPLKEQNIYTLPEYNQPINPMTGEILPDPQRPNLGMDTGATEYKYTYGFDDGDVDVPSIVAGQYIGDQAIDRYRLTGERFKTMADPGSYSKFYDQIGQLGLMQEKHGGSVKRVKIKSLPKNWKTK
jgi:hypothetical protein